MGYPYANNYIVTNRCSLCPLQEVLQDLGCVQSWVDSLCGHRHVPFSATHAANYRTQQGQDLQKCGYMFRLYCAPLHIRIQRAWSVAHGARDSFLDEVFTEIWPTHAKKNLILQPSTL